MAAALIVSAQYGHTLRFTEVQVQNSNNRTQASAQEDHVVPTRLIAGVAGKTASLERSP
jgi:uncharacterized alpha/beta hydrolase family protein